MKKVLLCAMALAAVCATASAEEWTLNAKDATDIQGTLVDEKPAEGSDKGEAKHYKPLESLKIGDFSFTFTKGGSTNDAAYYYPMSTKPDGDCTIRLYGNKGQEGNSMTITAPAGKKIAKIDFKGSNGTANASINASVGAVTGVTKTAAVWASEEAVEAVTLTFTQNFRIISMNVSSDAGDPQPPTGEKYSKTTSLTTGQYVILCDGQLCTPIDASLGYGRMNLVAATMDGEDVVTTSDNEYTITVADNKATIQDKSGRFYSMDASHLTTFQMYNETNEYSYWTYEFSGDNVKFTNATNTECFVCQSKGNQGTFYTNVAPAKNPTEFNLPVLYKKVASGVADIVVEENAPAVYYNLQGVRVDNPTSGMYIVVKGGKSQKVAF